MTRTRPTFTTLWAALALLAAPALSGAQPCDLPPEIVSATTIGDPQEKQIRDCVAANLRLLESDSRTDMKKGKESLLKPLQNTQASVTFRLRYSEVLAPALERIAEKDNPAGQSEPRAINALIVTGALGTTQAANVLDRFSQDPRVAVRYTAVAAYKRMFQAINGAAHAMTPDDAKGVVRGLGGRLAKEEDPQVFDACARALIDAAEITKPEFADVRRLALETLARVSGERLRALPIQPEADPFIATMVRIGGVLRDAPARQNLPEATNRLILEVGADLWAHLVKRIQAGQLPLIKAGDDPAAAEARRAERSLYVQAVQVGQATMFFAGSKMGDGNGRPFEPQDPVKWMAEANPEGDARFVKRALELLGPGGILTKPPFNYAPDRFLPNK